MADISEFNINDTLYNLKDNQARQDIISLSSNFDNYLPLTGGIVTGDISITSDIDLNNPPSTGNTWSPSFKITDISNNTSLGILRIFQNNSNTIDLRFGTWRTIGTTTYNNSLDLKIDSSGNKQVAVSDQSAWRTGLGLGSVATESIVPLEKGGTGATTRIGATGAVHNLFAENVGASTNYFLTLYSSGGGWQKAGYATPTVVWEVLGGGSIGKKDTLAASDITTGVLTVQRGGSGTGSTNTLTFNRNTTNTSSGTFTIYNWGKVVTITGYQVQLKSNASSSGTTIAQVTSGYRPPGTVYGWGGFTSHNGLIAINSSGNILAYSPLKSATNIYFAITYVID